MSARENKLALSAAIGMTNYTVWASEKGCESTLLLTLSSSRKLSPTNLSHKTVNRAAQFAHCVNCIKSLSDIWAERRGACKPQAKNMYTNLVMPGLLDNNSQQ